MTPDVAFQPPEPIAAHRSSTDATARAAHAAAARGAGSAAAMPPLQLCQLRRREDKTESVRATVAKSPAGGICCVSSVVCERDMES
ncbi:hypothetical protein E2562_006670 [Oryza meyeriana var. granulata]|uniref:Uncharacterized protein n=1 Tax=Oryza meyeriana var. granulata TaxID=110450 RepID=A0A6G1EGH2_9ORYZ|nr:hypothetical protein E2562_006670 [Oryza meyeriana var. granulata]